MRSRLRGEEHIGNVAIMTTLTEKDIQRNMRAVAHAVGQQELEGLKVPAETVADLHRAARGEIDTHEVIRNIYRRLQNVPLLRK
jgi:Antitoxin VbhA